MVTGPCMELDINLPVMVIVRSVKLYIYWPVMVTFPSMELDILAINGNCSRCGAR